MSRKSLTRSGRLAGIHCGLLSAPALVATLVVLLVTHSARAERLQDPTRPLTFAPPTAAAKAAPVWRLDSILYGPNRHVAVINGTTVMPGDRIDGARVLAISPTRVILNVSGQQHILHWQTLPQVRQNP